MYLMDPNHGEDRRTRALEAAHRALEVSSDAARSAYQGTAHALGHAWDAASEKAADVGSTAYDAMPSAKDVRKGGERWMDRAREMGSNAASSVSDTTHSWLDSARNMLPRSAHLERHSEYAMNPTGVSLTALSALALGAGAMWLMDASRGRGRRAWLGQKATRFMNEIGTFSRATGRHLRNKAQGYYHETASAVRDGASAVRDGASAVRDGAQSVSESMSGS